MTTSKQAEVVQVLRERLATKLSMAPEDIDVSSRFSEDLGLDSLSAVELLVEVEDRFGVVVTDEEAAHLATVGAAAEFIASRLPS
jgi:acyl carrier protein